MFVDKRELFHCIIGNIMYDKKNKYNYLTLKHLIFYYFL